MTEARLQTPATDLRDTKRIGRATITLFAIPSGDIRMKDPVEQEVIDEVEAGLQAAGFRVERVDAKTAPARSVAVTISKFSFSNYNWVWPIVPTWGDLEIGLSVKDGSGKTVYNRRFAGSGTSMCLLGNCAFTRATRSAMTAALEELIEAASTDEFRRAVTGGS